MRDLLVLVLRSDVALAWLGTGVLDDREETTDLAEDGRRVEHVDKTRGELWTNARGRILHRTWNGITNGKDREDTADDGDEGEKDLHASLVLASRVKIKEVEEEGEWSNEINTDRADVAKTSETLWTGETIITRLLVTTKWERLVHVGTALKVIDRVHTGLKLGAVQVSAKLIRREETRRESEVTVVSKTNSFLIRVVLDLEDGHDRTEDLFLGNKSSLWNVGKDSWWVEAALREWVVRGWDVTTGKDLGTLGDSVIDELLVVEHLARTHTDGTAINRGITKRGTDLELGDDGLNLGAELVINLLINEESLWASTVLTHVLPNTTDGGLDNGGNIDIISDDERILTTKLKDDWGEVIRGGLGDDSTDLRGADKDELVNARLDESSTSLTVTDDELN